MSRPLKIAMIGQRGVPATWGGIERHVEEIGRRLVDLGNEVTIYCRPNYSDDQLASHKGMKLRYLPTIGTKRLDAIVHSAISTFVAMRQRPDVIHYHALGPGLLTPFPRYLSGVKVVQTIHGLDNRRAKWGIGAKAILGAAAWLSKRVPDRTITVSESLRDAYFDDGCRATYIPNGVDVDEAPTFDHGEEIGVEADNFVLFVGRIVPEKAPDVLVEAFRMLDTDAKLVIAGDSSFTSNFVQQVRDAAKGDDRILFPGYVYGEKLEWLYRNAAVFVLPSRLEGLPLTLLEAGARGVPVIASDIPPHCEVLVNDGPGHRLVEAGNAQSLSIAISSSLTALHEEKIGAKELAARISENYDWDAAARQTAAVYVEVTNTSGQAS